MERWDTLWDGGWTFCFDDSAFMPSTDSFLLGSFPPLRQGWRRGRLLRKKWVGLY